MAAWQDWFRSWKKPIHRPAWATFFTDPQFAEFHRIVEDHFRKQGQKISWPEGIVAVRPNEPGGMQQLGLVNLAQVCAGSPAKDWPAIVTEHFRMLQKSQNEQRALESRLPDFEQVRDLLAVRLWPEDYLRELDGAKMIHRRDVPGAISALVYDLPSSIRNVTPEEASSWGLSEDELYRVALENVRETCIPDVSDQSLGDGLEVVVLSDESFFVASHALKLEERYPRCVGDFGALIGIPHRHVLLAYPIQSLEVVKAIPKLIAVVIGMEREGPGSISPRLYWLQHGEFVDLPYEIKDQALHFAPPESFLEMLALLGDQTLVDEESDADSDDLSGGLSDDPDDDSDR